MEVNAAVGALKEQLTALQTNTEPSRDNIIKLNLREAEENLARQAPHVKALGNARFSCRGAASCPLSLLS